MGTKKLQPWSAAVWELAGRQHGVVARAQLLDLGMSGEAVRHRLRCGRLHRLAQGVYVVGRPDVTQHGRWMGAVLACGPGALLSHRSAAALWGLLPVRPGPIDVAVPADVARRRPGIRVHRKVGVGEGVRRFVEGIPVTDPVATLVDLATCVSDKELEAAVNEADHLDLIDPGGLRGALGSHPGQPGVGRLRTLLDAHTFVLTDTELERRFLPIARLAGLPLPQTQVWLSGRRVDFHWPELGLVVECDSLRYHRTPAKQTNDLRRDQEHMLAGRTPLRFSHYQVRYEPAHVQQMLKTMARRLRGNG